MLSSSSSSDNNNNNTEIRHSGKAHIRGRIRRVWRPRYLELLSVGHLRYYEVKTLKYTLIVSYARILDVTTIRDLHVGLPRGMYGFLVRGQRLVYNNHFDNVNNLEQHQQQQQQQHLLLEYEQPVRDYLCAVSSLEEAQMWVVALQWAASLHDSFFQWWKVDLVTPTAAAAARALPSQQQQPLKVEIQQPKGRVLVSKVVSYTLVRVGTATFDVGYEIHVILLDTLSFQEWKLLRTANEFRTLASSISEPDTILNRLSYKDRPSNQDLMKNVSILDSLLRSWVLSADVVNQKCFKDFLGLHTNQSQTYGMWKTYDPSCTVGTKQRHKLQVSRDEFVKQWLQTRKPRISNEYAVKWIAFWHDRNRHVFWIGSAFVVSAALPIVVKNYNVTVPIRLDCLVASWIGAAYIGLGISQWRGRPIRETTLRDAKNKKETPPPAIPQLLTSRDDSAVLVQDDHDMLASASEEEESDGESPQESSNEVNIESSRFLPSPLPEHPENSGVSCWSRPPHDIFHVRGLSYFKDKVKVPSGPAPLQCRGVDVWIADNPQRHIARHPAVLGGKLNDQDTFVVNFLLPFGNFVAYFDVPPLKEFPDRLRTVWTKFLKGDQQYRDARLKLLPVVVEGPWIVKTAVGPGKSPALLGKVIPLQYFFRHPKGKSKGVYEVDVIITASTIATGILSVVKSQTKSVTIAFAFIIEAAEQSELPETVLCSFQVHSLDLEDCPRLPECNLDQLQED